MKLTKINISNRTKFKSWFGVSYNYNKTIYSEWTDGDIFKYEFDRYGITIKKTMNNEEI